MPNFTWLRKGDNLPASAAAQLLLNKAGAGITVDGYYGSNTKSAVWTYQSGTPGLSVDGVIGQNTWGSLMRHKQLQIIDFVDVTDPDLLGSEVAYLRSIGANPIFYEASGRGADIAVNDIAQRMNQTTLLRFHGHGAPGAAGVSDGEDDGGEDNSFGLNWATANRLRRLFGLFAPHGSIQFMHCQVGRGTDGRRFLRMVAEATGVPATAAIRDQYGSTLRETMRFEGPTVTAFPGNVSLKAWSTALPPM